MSTSFGIEPAAATVLRDVEGDAGAVGVVHRLEGLREIGDPGEQRDLVAAQSLGVAESAPMLVERPHGFDGRRRKAQLARDRRAALAAHGDEVAGHALGAGDRDEVANALEDGLADADVAGGREGEAEAVVPVDDLHPRLHVAVVRAEQRGHAGGVARAAGVLQQQRVVERRALLGGERQLVGDAHADQAGADGVAEWLAFGQIEGVGERAEYFGKADLHR